VLLKSSRGLESVMPTVDVFNLQNQVVSQVDLNGEVFDAPVKSELVHQVVRMQMARRRAGTACTKNRSLVRGGGKKPYRQKGTGRARAGSRRSPLWRGGGVVFGPTPRDYAFKVNRKVRKAALKAVLTQKLKDGDLKIVDRMEMPQIRTKAMVDVLDRLGIESALIVLPARDEAVEKSARNIPYVKVLPVEGLNVYDALRYRSLVIVRDCLRSIEQRVGIS
jgi:large subunit ribosomal protein L4